MEVLADNIMIGPFILGAIITGIVLFIVAFINRDKKDK